MLKLNKFGMFVPRVATPTARRAILTNWICLKSFCRSFFELHDHSAVSDDQRFVLPENWTEQLRNKADFTRFKGNVHVLKNEREEKELLRGARVLQDLRTREALGLDVEFMPYRGGVKVCVIQLACHDTAILWRSGRAAGQLPPFLISLLVDSTILKVRRCNLSLIDWTSHFKCLRSILEYTTSSDHYCLNASFYKRIYRYDKRINQSCGVF